jgi:Cu+-exporting ATPase
MEKKLNIDGMSCGHCTGRVQKYLEGTSGVSGVNVDLEKKEATFSAESSVDMDTIVKDINGFGFKTEAK